MFVAAIRRLPGGVFVKAPKSQGMTAVPVETTISNLSTYFDTWPKGRSSFLLYGPRRLLSTGPCDPASPPADSTSAPQAGSGSGGTGGKGSSSEGDGELQVYGPALHAPLAGEPAAGAAAVAAAAKAAAAAARPLGLAGLLRRFGRGEKLVMVTAYDFPSARFARSAGVELVLVGDSIGNCRLGLPDTVGVTMDDMLSATRAVRRGLDAPAATTPPGPKPVLVGDMPFGSYLLEADALRNAAAFRMAGVDLVKLEGGREMAPFVRSLTVAGIPVMGHIGLQPQSASLQGGLRLQGTTAESARRLVSDAEELAAAGATTLVLECVPVEVGAAVQAAVPGVPVIGIGAGGAVGGQVLVCDDLLQLHGKPPSFVKPFADLQAISTAAYEAYTTEVRSGAFPGADHARNMKPQELEKFREAAPEHILGALDSAARPCQSPAAVALGVEEAARPSPQPRSPVGQPMEVAAGRFVVPAASPQSRAVRPATTLAAGAKEVCVEVLETRDQVLAWRQASGRGRVALVPTMGSLHEGHLALVDEAARQADEVLVSIFVNPAQFAEGEDLERYPRTLERDLELLQARGVRAVFAPGPQEMYPSGSPGGTLVVPKFVEGKSEAACRPSFFTGVATVCLKLFNLCEPNVVVFGQKDAMQCVVISHMLSDLLLDTRISLVVVPTSREADGLARSSRNSYFTPEMRRRAPAIYAALSEATSVEGATPGSVRRTVQASLESEGMVVGYVSVAGAGEVEEKEDSEPLANSVVSVACLVRDGETECRLIDNVVVPE